MTARRVLLALALVVVVADLAQPLVLPWEDRFWAAFAGAGVYALVAAGAWRAWRWTMWVAMAMPVVPLATLLGWALGMPVPVAPNPWMVGIAAVQLAAGGAAWTARAEVSRA